MSFEPWLLSLALLAGAWLLAACSARLLHFLTRWLPRWLIASLAQGVALFPQAALAWVFIGWWVGSRGLPVFSLMPVAESSAWAPAQQWALLAWFWVPPVFFLALPWTAHHLSFLSRGCALWHRQSAATVLPALVWLAVVEDVFHLPGALAGIIPALHGQGGPSVLLALMPLAVLAVLFWLVISAGPRYELPYVPSAEEQIRAGALAVGYSPEEADRIHVRPRRIRRYIACIFSLASWALSLWACLGFPGDSVRQHAFEQAFGHALQQPWAPFQVAWPYAVCALFLWLLGRMIHPSRR